MEMRIPITLGNIIKSNINNCVFIVLKTTYKESIIKLDFST